MSPLSPEAPVAEPRVLIVILNWNSCDETLVAVRSVGEMDYANKHILVVDNGSADDSVERLRALEGPGLDLIALPENTGFTGGCNLGLEKGLRESFDYVWLLNNDATTDRETLRSLVRRAEAGPKTGLVSPRIASLQEPEKQLNLGGLYKPEVPAFESTKNMAKAREWAERHRDRYMLMGTALLVRVELIRAIGTLDDAMFAYWEDTDYSLRSIQAGFENYLDFDSVIYHKEKDAGTQALEMKPHYWYYMARNELRFWRKHARGLARWKAFWWTYQFNLNNLRLVRGNDLSRRAILAGLWDGVWGKTGPYTPARRMPGLICWFAERQSALAPAR